ncbi:MAG: copper resistance protein CopC [Solirubrobacteraceae bacterium]
MAATLAVAFALLAAASAGAHPLLLATDPLSGTIVQASPRQLTLVFSENAVLKGSALTLQTVSGRALGLSAPANLSGQPGMVAKLQDSLDPGVYEVHWVALGDDGHTTAGSFRFGVAAANGASPPGVAALGAPGAGAGSGSAGEEGAGPIAARWLALLGAAFLAGGGLLALVLSRLRSGQALREPAGRAYRRGARVAVLACLLGSAGGLLVVMSAGAGSGLHPALLTASLPGWLSILRVAVAVGLAAAVWLAGRGRSSGSPALSAIGMTGGFALLLGYALDGHAAAVGTHRGLAMVEQSAHLWAVGAWIGGVMLLLVLALQARGAVGVTLAPALRAFAPVAVIAVLVIALTGVLVAIREVAHFYFLRWSDYGHLVIVKGALLVILLALGASAFLRTRRAPGGALMGRMFSLEVGVMAATIAVAAALAGSTQGAGRLLPAQAGNLLAGSAFFTLPDTYGLARLSLTPARPGANELIMAQDVTQDAVISKGAVRVPPLIQPQTVSAELSCSCARAPVRAVLSRVGAVWKAAVALPRTGLWNASLDVDRRPAIGTAILPVGVPSAPGSTPVTVADITDLSGPEAARCRRQAIGLQLAVAAVNAGGGIGERKLALLVLDHGGRSDRVAALVDQARRSGAVAMALCGAPAAVALRVPGAPPAVADDPQMPLVSGILYRLAADPEAEGIAAGQYIALNGFLANRNAPRRVSALVGPNPLERSRVQGLEAYLSQHGIAVDVIPVSATNADRAVARALDPVRYDASYMDAGADVLDPGLRSFRQIALGEPVAILGSSELMSERFVLRSGTPGALGQVRAFSEISPDTRDGIGFASLVSATYVAEPPTIDGLRGFALGRILGRALQGGLSPAAIEHGLLHAQGASDAPVSWPSAAAPAVGTYHLELFGATFLPENLVPQSAGGGQVEGTYFSEGAWTLQSSQPYGPQLAHATP